MIGKYGEKPKSEFLRNVSVRSISENEENVNGKIMTEAICRRSTA